MSSGSSGSDSGVCNGWNGGDELGMMTCWKNGSVPDHCTRWKSCCNRSQGCFWNSTKSACKAAANTYTGYC